MRGREGEGYWIPKREKELDGDDDSRSSSGSRWQLQLGRRGSERWVDGDGEIDGDLQQRRWRREQAREGAIWAVR